MGEIDGKLLFVDEININHANERYHCGSSEHKMKEDYEAKALAKAEAKGPKEVLKISMP